MRTRYSGIILLAFTLAALVAISGSSSPVSASPCTAQLGYAILSTTQSSYNSNITITVPVSANCYAGNQLYAIGTAYDTATNRNLGSASTVLTTTSGYMYPGTSTGQLVFNLPASMVGRKVQVNAAIYGAYQNGYYAGAALANTNALLQINPNNYQNSYNYQYGNSYYYSYGSCSQNPNCYSPGYFNGNYYATCLPGGNGITVQCSGYLYQPLTGCVELAVPVYNGYWFESPVYQYYTLHNLTSSYSLDWRWVTVTGQLYQGYNTGLSNTACPGNYIVVNSIA